MQFINRKMDRYDKMGGDFDMHAGGFSELIGNEQIKEHFRNAVQTGKVYMRSLQGRYHTAMS